MNILQEIVQNKHEEVKLCKEVMPVELLEKEEYFNRKCFSLKYALKQGSGIIAEFKRKSPSKGIINNNVSVETVTTGYIQAGASALSVLTDTIYFGGTLSDLVAARKANICPILRKDFIVDEYQVVESKANGADVILLIAEALEKEKIHALAGLAKQLGMEVLLELHSLQALEKISPLVDLIGVNNRNLSDFTVDISCSKELSKIIPDSFVKVSESGISSPDVVKELRMYGFSGFLIGENFMKKPDPVAECKNFISLL